MPDLVTLIVSALVMFGPGAAILAATGQATLLGPYLFPAAALSVTTVVAGVALTACLLLGLTLAWVTSVLLVTTLVCASIAVRGAVGAEAVQHIRAALGVHWVVGAMALLAAILGLSVGTTTGGDTAFHAGIGVKLMELDDPSFRGMSRFLGGDPNPVYLLPVWHAIVGVAASLAGVEWLQVFWLLPTIVVPTMLLAHAGLARMLLGSDRAAALAALVYLCTRALLSDMPREIYYSSLPGFVALEIVLLATLAAFLVAVTDSDSRRRRGACVVLAAGTLAIGMLHFNYLLYEALAVGGYLVLWLLAAPRRRAEVRRHLVAGAVCLAAALVTVAPTVPAVLAMERGTAKERLHDSEDRSWNVGVAVVGDVNTGDYRLHPRIIVPATGLSILGMLGALAALGLVRTRRMWLIGGWLAAVLLITQSRSLFPSLVDVSSISTFLRADSATPIVFGAVLALLAIARAAEARWRQGGPHRVTALAYLAITAGALVVATDRQYALRAAPLADLVAVATGLIAAGLVVLAVVCIVRVWRRGRLRIDDGPPAVASAGWAATAAVAAVALIGSASVVAPSLAGILGQTGTRPANVLELYRFQMWEPQFREALTALPDETVLLANPAESYRIMAIAPVYVVADTKTRVANSPTNRIPDRMAAIERFYAADATDAERLAIIADEGVTAVVYDGKKDGPAVRKLLHGHPEIFQLESRPKARLRLFTVRHEALVSALENADR